MKRLLPKYYRKLNKGCRQAAAQQKTPDTLVTEWVSAHLETGGSDADAELAAFEQEIAAFEALKPTLLEQYRRQYVAIYQGEVVASGDKKLDVSRQVREQYGPIVYYVELVAPDSPRKVRRRYRPVDGGNLA